MFMLRVSGSLGKAQRFDAFAMPVRGWRLVTETWHFLRLLFMKLGTPYCPACAVPIRPMSAESILAILLDEFKGRRVSTLAPLVVLRKGIYRELARWAAAKGFERLRVDGKLLDTVSWPRLDRFREHDIDLPVADLAIAARRERQLSASASGAARVPRRVQSGLWRRTARWNKL